MIYVKSEMGALAIKDRRAVEITRAQRSALIMFDGRRPVRAVLDATSALGVSATDIDTLVSIGLLVPMADSLPLAEVVAPAAADGTGTAPTGAEPTPAPADEAEHARRYRQAYALATQLTASLGLKGFKLNLAVEAAQGLEGLVELLPRLHAAVGDERLRPLKRALEGR